MYSILLIQFHRPLPFCCAQLLILEVVYVPGTLYIIHDDHMNVYNPLLALYTFIFHFVSPLFLNKIVNVTVRDNFSVIKYE